MPGFSGAGMDVQEVLWPQLSHYAADGVFHLEGWMLDETAAVCEVLAGLMAEGGDPAHLLARIRSGYVPLWVHATFREAHELGVALPSPIATPDRLNRWYVHLAEALLGAPPDRGGDVLRCEAKALRG